MPQVAEDVRLTNTQRGSGRWLTHFQVGEQVRFCLGLIAPSTRALRSDTEKKEVVFYPEIGAPSPVEFCQASLLFEGEARKRGYIIPA